MLVSAKAAADIQMLMEQAGQTNRLGRAPPRQEPIRVPARLDWHEVKKVAHYWLEVDAFAQPMRCGKIHCRIDWVEGKPQSAIPITTKCASDDVLVAAGPR